MSKFTPESISRPQLRPRIKAIKEFCTQREREGFLKCLGNQKVCEIRKVYFQMVFRDFQGIDFLYGHMVVASKPRPIRNTSFNQGMINMRGNPCIGLRRSWRLSLKRLPPKVTPKWQSTKLHPRLRMYLLRASKR